MRFGSGWSAAVLAGWRMAVRRGAAADAIWTAVAFSAYFWLSAAFAFWKMRP